MPDEAKLRSKREAFLEDVHWLDTEYKEHLTHSFLAAFRMTEVPKQAAQWRQGYFDSLTSNLGDESFGNDDLSENERDDGRQYSMNLVGKIQGKCLTK